MEILQVVGTACLSLPIQGDPTGKGGKLGNSFDLALLNCCLLSLHFLPSQPVTVCVLVETRGAESECFS